MAAPNKPQRPEDHVGIPPHDDGDASYALWKPDLMWERERVILFDSHETPLVRAIGYHPAKRKVR